MLYSYPNIASPRNRSPHLQRYEECNTKEQPKKLPSWKFSCAPRLPPNNSPTCKEMRRQYTPHSNIRVGFSNLLSNEHCRFIDLYLFLGRRNGENREAPHDCTKTNDHNARLHPVVQALTGTKYEHSYSGSGQTYPSDTVETSSYDTIPQALNKHRNLQSNW